jgi:hypothetical protein
VCTSAIGKHIRRQNCEDMFQAYFFGITNLWKADIFLEEGKLRKNRKCARSDFQQKSNKRLVRVEGKLELTLHPASSKCTIGLEP